MLHVNKCLIHSLVYIATQFVNNITMLRNLNVKTATEILSGNVCTLERHVKFLLALLNNTQCTC